ncbi:MAG TPA: hypothetical protein VFG83_10105 [Kofleriaceae bacterium]|nr:hypothetical protein [Kofleriaceae bacterium]
MGKVSQVRMARRSRQGGRGGEDNPRDREQRKDKAADGTKNKNLPAAGDAAEQGVSDDEITRGQAKGAGTSPAPAPKSSAGASSKPAAGAGDRQPIQTKATRQPIRAKKPRSPMKTKAARTPIRVGGTRDHHPFTIDLPAADDGGDAEPVELEPITMPRVDVDIPEYRRSGLANKREEWERQRSNRSPGLEQAGNALTAFARSMSGAPSEDTAGSATPAHAEGAQADQRNPYKWENLPPSIRKAETERFDAHQETGW